MGISESGNFEWFQMVGGLTNLWKFSDQCGEKCEIVIRNFYREQLFENVNICFYFL